MKLSYTFFLSGTNLRRRKLRSVLTIGGMAVGIALIVFLISLGFGLQNLVRGQITNVEALSILDVSKGESTLLKLDQNTINEFQNIEDVEKVSPSLSLSGQIVKDEAGTDVAIYGINPDFLSIEGVRVNVGEEFSGSGEPELIITSTALNLIGIADYQSTIGSTIIVRVLVAQRIEGTEEEELVSKDINAKVVGVILNEEEELSLAYMPIEFLVSIGFEPDYSAAKVQVDKDENGEFTLARVKVTDEEKLPEVRKQIEAMGYQVDSIADTVGQIDKIFLVFQIIVAGFGAIALFVAALGALNTLTVSLLERTREIGLMKALGSTSGDIYRLFLVEAIVIGMLGGIIGLLLGVAAGELVNVGVNSLATRLGGDSVDLFDMPMFFIIGILVVVFLVSLITGLYPAMRAAKINPLDALRYE